MSAQKRSREVTCSMVQTGQSSPIFAIFFTTFKIIYLKKKGNLNSFHLLRVGIVF